MTENELLSLRIRELETWRQECKDVGERLIATDREARKECDHENAKPYTDQNPPLPLGTTFSEMFARALKEGSEKVICDIAHAVSAFAGEYPTEDSIRQMQPALLQPHLIKCIRERGELLGKCLDAEKENDKLTRQNRVLLKDSTETRMLLIATIGKPNDPELTSTDMIKDMASANAVLKEEIEAAHQECREVRDKYNSLTHEFMGERSDKEKAQWERDELQKWKESALTKSISGTAVAELVKLRKENKELKGCNRELVDSVNAIAAERNEALSVNIDLLGKVEQLTGERDAARLQAEKRSRHISVTELAEIYSLNIPDGHPPHVLIGEPYSTVDGYMEAARRLAWYDFFKTSKAEEVAKYPTLQMVTRGPGRANDGHVEKKLATKEEKRPIAKIRQEGGYWEDVYSSNEVHGMTLAEVTIYPLATEYERQQILACVKPKEQQWRHINTGETLKEGDEYWRAETEKWDSFDPGVIGEPLKFSGWPTRRKLP